MISSSSKWIKHLSTDWLWLRNHCTTVKKTKQAHAFLLRNRLFDENLAVSKLISFLAISESGKLDYARKIFTQIENPDMFIWNTMIRGYARSINPSEAISFYYLMVQSGVVADNYTYPFVLTACARLAAPELGRRFHSETVKIGLESDVFVLNSLIQMYANCRFLDVARRLFDGNPLRDVVTWNVMIGAYIDRGIYEQAFNWFEEMRQLDYIQPDSVTLLHLVSACTQLGNLEQGRLLHFYSKELALDTNLRLCNAILDMYCKCGDLESAMEVFDSMPERDLLSWTSLLSGLTNSGHFIEALHFFGQMQSVNIRPDEITLVTVLSACAQTGALDQGKYIHLLIDRYKVNRDIILETALVDMYAKCGNINFSLQVFNKMRVKNVFTWNTMIGGLAMHGHGQQAMALFERMKQEGSMPDDVTFIAFLCACSHAGLVKEGIEVFKLMQEVYLIKPRMEHYGCMVDLLCRARLVDDALAFIENMPIKANAVLWATLLGACRIGGHPELAEKVGKRVIELEPDSDGRYVQLSNLYAGIHRWDEAMKIRNQMTLKKIEKTPGYSWIELNGMIHQFIAGDRAHTQTEEIYMMVEEMYQRVKLAGGHITGTTQVLFDIDEEEKEHSLFLHSEKLAIAFGLMSTAPGSPIRIVKNLRVCNDCHSFVKVISKVFNREIIARDRNRFHHFREGKCSCMDFW
ncbi:pentatricopeptide repeat-containing protein At1g08070, chloroplastic-like [Telopea speciosissima]|uniref:pentatricopeptide repeat-containing protein At1g08070, chloroplastic-like n=1 Tax=Telopea speciosissima TaxID=54955 RepID=UPI001CC5043B|nr:pentatricopeptide repeat-containing protein At1g08070, chloroplastic-like [Telopea speciosissima]